MESEASISLQASLSKIRHHTNSKLENQKAPAQLLQAIESTLKEQKTGSSQENELNKTIHQESASPNEYFLALDSMVGKATDPQVSTAEDGIDAIRGGWVTLGVQSG